ncbi:unnamed protein product [Cylicostephanus goldi]|uniref:Sulfotransferase domain-containing protein n=1 Tax=Cylicostephanus goldi TaxID=71465 RepID=A0A3P6QTH5_CYLGO|nr:unnamed protein product [Cylicostephanus goldi]
MKHSKIRLHLFSFNCLKKDLFHGRNDVLKKTPLTIEVLVYGLMCHIQKIMSTILTGIFSYNPLFNLPLCRSDYHGFTIADVLGTRLKFVVVRDPIDRFLSGFLDKCLRSPPALCFGCRTIGCFIMAMHSRLWGAYKSSRPTHHIMENHLAPHRYCDFKDHLQSFIVIKYKNGQNGSLELANILDDIFKSAMVPKLLRDTIRREILSEQFFDFDMMKLTCSLDFKLHGMLQLVKCDILHSSQKGDEKSKKKCLEIKPCSIYC